MGTRLLTNTSTIITKIILVYRMFLRDSQMQTLTFDSKYMLGPHLFKFRQLLCSSATYHVMLKVKLFCVIPQEAIPQKACIEGIPFLWIPNALLKKKETLSLTNTAPVNSFNGPLSLLYFCSNFTKRLHSHPHNVVGKLVLRTKAKSQNGVLETLESESEFLHNIWR